MILGVMHDKAIENPTIELVRKFISENEELTIDVETNSKNRRTALLMGFSISNRHGGFYIACRYWDTTSSELRLATHYNDYLQLVGTLVGKKLQTWNGAFDLPVLLTNTNVDLLPYLHTDGMLLRHTVNENEFSYGLKDIARAEFGESAADEQTELKQAVLDAGGRWTKDHKDMFMAPTEILGKYCIKDGILTSKLIDIDKRKLRADGLETYFWQDEKMPLYREVTIPMELRGIALDMPLIQATKAELLQDLQKIEQSILGQIDHLLTEFRQWWFDKEYAPSRTGAFAQGICAFNNLPLPKTGSNKYSLAKDAIEALPDGHWKAVLQQKERMTPEEIAQIQNFLWQQDGCPKMFNLASKHHLKKLFFDKLDEVPLSRTEKGAPQVDDEFIQSVMGRYEWAKELHIYNKLCKILGTYIERPLDLQEGGRYYPSFFQHRTVSGRYAGDLQQLPKKIEDGEDEHELVKKYTNRIRDFFIADDGRVLIDADYESLEPHIFAHVSGEQKIQNIFRQGHDFYSTIAIMTEKLQGVSADKRADNYLGKVMKYRRQKAKAYSLGIPYGLTGYKLQFELGIPLSEAEDLVEGYLEAFPALREWMQRSERQALSQGFIRTEGGLIRRFPRLQQIYKKYGNIILDDLELWKALNESPGLYQIAKKERKELKNYLNNAKNVQIQGLAASIMNRACIALNRAYRTANIDALIVAQIHDEALVSCRADQAEEAAKIMQKTLENIWKLSVELKAEPIIGTRYGQIK